MTVTPFYAGLLALFFFVLSMRVVQVRGQANFAEYVPLILLMMAFLELLHGVALSFTAQWWFGRFCAPSCVVLGVYP